MRLPTASNRVVTRCFDVVAGVSVGNPFTNANKLLDHVLAYGPDAARQPPPRAARGPVSAGRVDRTGDGGSAGTATGSPNAGTWTNRKLVCGEMWAAGR